MGDPLGDSWSTPGPSWTPFEAIQWRGIVHSDGLPALLDADFPTRLLAVLTPAPPPPARVAAADYAPLTGGRAYDQPPQDMRPWLAMLIAALLIAERWLATRRSRGISP